MSNTVFLGTPHLTTPDAAIYLGLSKKTLEKWRLAGSGPPYRRYGGRIFYVTKELQTWAEGQSFSSTSQYLVRRKRSTGK
jgi:hypothetical protein